MPKPLMNVSGPSSQPDAGSSHTNTTASSSSTSGRATSTSPILYLPRELLQSIVSQTTPESVVALAATCRSLRAQLCDTYIWRRVYSNRFDLPLGAAGGGEEGQGRIHALALETASWQQRQASRKRTAEKAKQREESEGESERWDAEGQTKRLALAVKKVRIGAACELDMLHHQADTVRALLAAAVSISPRCVKPGDFNERDLTSRTARTLSRLFSESKWGKVAYSNWIYPRETTSQLAQHHRAMVRAERKADQQELELDSHGRLQQGDRLPTSKGSISALPTSLRKVWREGKKLNARLYKKPGELALVDEEAAAHLHCLYGARDYLVNGAENDSEDEANGGDGWPSRVMRGEVGIEEGRTTTRPDEARGWCVIRETVFQQGSMDAFTHGSNVDWTGEFRVKEVERRDFPAEGSSYVELDGALADSDDDEEVAAERRLYTPVLKNLEGGFSLGSKSGSEGDALLRAAARRIVYDVSRFGWENHYGPFHVFRSSPARRRRDSVDAGESERKGSDASRRSHSHTETITRSPQPASASPDAYDSDDASDAAFEYEEGDESEEGFEYDEDFDDVVEEGWDMEDFRVLVSQAYGSVPRKAARALLQNGESLPEKRIDWLVVEAAQVVMHCNLFHAQLHGWGSGFLNQLANPFALSPQLGMPKSTVPFGVAKDGSNDTPDNEPDHTITSHERAELWARATHTLCTPCGWDHSRGEQSLQSEASSSAASGIHDWARVEGVWCGTFAFLPFADWILYNASTALQRGYKVHAEDTRELLEHSSHTLATEGEAIGDFVQIRLELIERPEDVEAEVVEDAEYPPLYFQGETLRHDVDGTAAVRGFPRGVIRPVFALDKAGRKTRAIEGIHWSVVHSYDDAERWKLEGVQAGQPGTRAAVYGIWTDAERDREAAATPCGAWCYWRVDDRKWKDVDVEIGKSKARVHGNRGHNWI